MPKHESNYVLQLADKTSCPECHEHVHLLCRRDGKNDVPWFYVCWWCENIYEVGKGRVLTTTEETVPESRFDDGAPVPSTPHEGGGAIPMPASGELEEEEADRQRSYPDAEDIDTSGRGADRYGTGE